MTTSIDLARRARTARAPPSRVASPRDGSALRRPERRTLVAARRLRRSPGALAPGLDGLRAAAAAGRAARVLAGAGTSLFLVLYARRQRDQPGPRRGRRPAGRRLVTSAGVVLVGLRWSASSAFTFVRGMDSAVAHSTSSRETMAFIGPDASLDQGGIVAAMVGTLEQVGDRGDHHACPLGIAHRGLPQRGRAAGWPASVRTVVEAMSACPTIVAGLFVYATLILTLGPGALRLRGRRSPCA